LLEKNAFFSYLLIMCWFVNILLDTTEMQEILVTQWVSGRWLRESPAWCGRLVMSVVVAEVVLKYQNVTEAAFEWPQ